MNSSSRNQWIWGFTSGAENWNGRLAMIAFVTIFIIELFTSQSIIILIGI